MQKVIVGSSRNTTSAIAGSVPPTCANISGGSGKRNGKKRPRMAAVAKKRRRTRFGDRLCDGGQPRKEF